MPLPFPELLLLQLFELFELFEEPFPPDFPLLHPLLDLLLFRSANELQKLREQKQILNKLYPRRAEEMKKQLHAFDL